MALDPSIILGIKPVEQDDPYKRAEVISALKDQKQIQNERALQLMGLQRQQQEAAATDKAFSAATTIDAQTGLPTLNRSQVVQSLKDSGFGTKAFGLQQDWAKGDLERQGVMLKQQGDALKNANEHVQFLGGIANSILAAPEAQRPILYAAQRARLLQAGQIGPNDMPPDYNEQFVQGEQQQSMKASEVFTAQHQKIEEQQKSVELAQTAARNAATQQNEQDSRLLQKRGQDLTDARERQRLSIEAGRLHLEQQKNSFDQDGAVESQAQQIAKGELPLPPQGRSNPRNAALTKRALEINPQLSTNLYTTVQDYYSSKGKTNQRITTLNTLSDHLQELQRLSDKAGFSPTGITSAGKDLRLGEQLFSNEDVKFLAGTGVAHEGELNKLRENTHSDFQSVRDNAYKTLAGYTADAARQVANQFTRDTRMPFDESRAFTDNTRKLLDSTATSSRTSKEGDTKTNSHGDTVIFKDGKWQIK